MQALTRMVELKEVNTADFVRLNGLSYLLDSLRTMLADPRVAKAGAKLCLAVLSSRSAAVLLIKHPEVRLRRVDCLFFGHGPLHRSTPRRSHRGVDGDGARGRRGLRVDGCESALVLVAARAVAGQAGDSGM